MKPRAAPKLRAAAPPPVRMTSEEAAAETRRVAAAVMDKAAAWIKPHGILPAELTVDCLPRPLTEEEVLLTAARVRESIADGARTLVCAVCACFVSRADQPLDTLPSKHLLEHDGEQTEEMPRHAKTTLQHDGKVYCLTKEGVTSPADHTVRLRVCRPCMAALSRKQKGKDSPVVPPRSLVRVDTGPWAHDEHGALPKPTYVERKLLSSVTAVRQVVVVRPTYGPTKRDLVGHVVVIPATNVELLHGKLLPLSFEDLPDQLTVRWTDHVTLDRVASTANPTAVHGQDTSRVSHVHLLSVLQVMFVAPAKTKEEALALAAKAKALRVRPHVLARWARFLVTYGQSNLHPEYKTGLNDAMLEWCDKQPPDAVVVPPAVLRADVHCSTNEQAKIILHTWQRNREGYAKTRSGHADDPDGEDPEAALLAWELDEDGDEGAQDDGWLWRS